MTQARLWTRDFIIVSAVNFLAVTVFYLLVVVIGLYAVNEFQASVSQSGLVVGAFIVGVLAGRLAVGPYVDRIGRKRSILIGLSLAVVACLFYFVKAGIGFLIINRFMHGVAVGISATAAATVVAHLIPASRRGEGVGYFSMSNSLAAAVGPFFGIYLVGHSGFSVILGVCCALSLVTFLVAATLRVPEAEPVPESAAPAKRFSLSRLLEPKVIPICSVIFLCALGFSSVMSFLSAFALERDLTEAASFFFLVYAITVLVSRPVTGRLLDSRGANIIMYPGFVFFALGLALVGMSTSATPLLAAAGLIGLGFGNMQSCAQAIALKLVDPHQMGMATSTFFIFLDAGLGFGPYLLGLIISQIGYANLYLSLGGLSMLTMVVYYFVHGRFGYK
jgi:MFS family permease